MLLGRSIMEGHLPTHLSWNQWTAMRRMAGCSESPRLWMSELRLVKRRHFQCRNGRARLRIFSPRGARPRPVRWRRGSFGRHEGGVMKRWMVVALGVAGLLVGVAVSVARLRSPAPSPIEARPECWAKVGPQVQGRCAPPARPHEGNCYIARWGHDCGMTY